METNDFSCERQADSVAGCDAARIGMVEFIKHPFLLIRGDSDSVIPEDHFGVLALPCKAYPDMAALWRKLDGVI